MTTVIQLFLILSIGKLFLVNALDESFANWTAAVRGPGKINSKLVQLYETFVKKLEFGSLNIHLTVVPFSIAFKDFFWCYDPYPCFQIGGPFISISHPISLPPYPPSVIGVKMELFTRKNPAKPFTFQDPNDIRSNDVGLSNFNSSAETKFIIGGFLDGDGRTTADLIPSLLAHSDCNVFHVNWFKGSLATYSQAVANTRMAGVILGRFIELLHNQTGLTLEQCHIIGHSLGSHIAGYAGEYLKTFSLKLGRISGLDPAGPFFVNADPIVRLDVTDAEFVDVIKTNKGSILTGHLGLDQNIGHIDVNPNGGKHQPSCSIPNFNILSVARNLSLLAVCSHLAAISFYAESIPAEGTNTTCHFTAFQCTSYGLYKLNLCFKSEKTVEMGYNSILYTESNSVPAPSEFYLDTNNASPFCKNIRK